MDGLWDCADAGVWRDTLARYPTVVAAQGVRALPGLDAWYREVLPGAIAARDPGYVTAEELARATEWKMARGVWRQRNLVLVRGNAAADVEARSREALAAVPREGAPIRLLSALRGVGPATASAVLAAAAPATYPFFDDLVASAIPGFGPVDFTAPCYRRYAAALRERAGLLGAGWTPVMVERALWAHAGGKAGARPG